MKKQVLAVFPKTVRQEELAAAVMKQELPQQADESEQEYRAFLAFCTGGPGVPLKDIGNAVGMSASGISRLSRRRTWLARIERWQIERRQMAQATQAQALPVAEANTDWPKRQEELKGEEWALHLELLAAGYEALDRWKTSGRVPMLSDVTKLLELASRLGRMSTGLPLEHTEVSGKNGAPIRIDIGAALVRAYGEAEVVDVQTVENG